LKVCIAEKPSVARDLAEILGAKNRKDGYFEGNGYQVTWTIGHLCTLKEPQDYDARLKFWKLEDLPIIPTKFGIKEIKNSGLEKQLKTITRLVTNASEVINCGDAGQEGELIQRWVLQKAQCKKPIKRLWISSLTEDAIREGFNNLKESKDYDNLYAAGSSRAIGDWLLGFNATRLYTLKFGENKQLLSIGRVQTPTLALIVNRHLEIENFKPETYWELKTKYREVIFSAKSGKFFSKEEAEKIIAQIENETFTIISFSKKKGKETAPRLFDLTSLQVECNKKFGFSAEFTLNTVQKLYEQKLVTYPRVDTTYLPDDLYPKIKGILSSMKGYFNLIQPLLTEPIRKSKNVFDDKKVTDHHAIIPTNITAGNVSGNEAKVYELIARRFIAAFYPDCIVSKTEVVGKVKEAEFKATGKQILEDGWRAVYNEEKKEEDNNSEQEEDQLLPEFVEGESGPHQPLLPEKQTKPPKPYTEATLLRAMETAGKQVADEELRDLMKENGIGRPSTRANIIETLFKRNYIKKEKKNLIPTITGIQLIQTIDYELLKSAELTGKWEKKLRDIEKGNFDVRIFMDEMKQMVTNIVTHVKSAPRKKIVFEKPVQNQKTQEGKSTTDKKERKKAEKQHLSEMICPKCKNGKIVKGQRAFGCSSYKTGCSFLIPFEFHGKTFTENHITSLIRSGKTSTIKGLKIAEKEIEAVVKFDKDFSLQLEEKEPKELICPKCKKGEIITGKTAYGCGDWKAGCNFRIPLVYMGKEITESHLSKLVGGKETSLMKGFIKDGSGEKLNGKLKLNSDYFIEFTNG
jgi:DNA topoisomerase-3